MEFEPDAALRDFEKVPLQYEGGVEAFMRHEVLPYAADAWYVPEGVKIGYEINFNRHFHRPEPMRTLEEIGTEIMDTEKVTDGLLAEILALGGVRGMGA